MRNIKGASALVLDENLVPILIEGAIKEITGYDKEYFLSGRMKWTDIIVPEDQALFLRSIQRIKSDPSASTDIEYRIQRKDREIIWVGDYIHFLLGYFGAKGRFQGFIRDINQRKKIDEKVEKRERTHLKEIHHRVNNNLQVISSLLSLQAEKFTDAEFLEALKESQIRIASIALIHAELYRSTNLVTLDFSAYLRKLTAYLFDSYKTLNKNITLKLNVEEVYLGMDTAIPLGIIVNEFISNAVKYAFSKGVNGEIIVNLCKRENYKQHREKSGDIRTDSECQSIKDLQFVLVIKDNGIGLPKEIDFKNTDSLGFQIINLLVEQIDGCIELERNKGTKFSIWFKNVDVYE